VLVFGQPEEKIVSGAQQTFTERGPRHHTTKIKEGLDKTAGHCREDIA
jgi:hypothetical protein